MLNARDDTRAGLRVRARREYGRCATVLTRKRGGGFEGSARESGGMEAEVAVARIGRCGGRSGGIGVVNAASSTEFMQCEALDRTRRRTLRRHQDGSGEREPKAGKVGSRKTLNSVELELFLSLGDLILVQ